jgi:hypothetical protein
VRIALTFPVVLAAFLVAQTAALRADSCVADQNGGLVCGEGKAAVRVFDDTTSPSKQYAFAWRSSEGLPTGRDLPPNNVENVLIRVSDGAVLAKLGGEYWSTGEMRANRYDLLAAWSPDSRAVIEVANSRWDSDSFVYYLLDGAAVTKLDLRALVEPVMKAKLPPRRREFNSFRVREELPVTLDARGHARFTAMVYVPKSETSLDYQVGVDIASKKGKPTARIVSMRRVKSD